MKTLLTYLISEITGIKEFSVEEQSEGSFSRFIVKSKKDEAGLIIGKNGKTIKTIRNLLRIRATLEKKGVAISVEGTE